LAAWSLQVVESRFKQVGQVEFDLVVCNV